MNDATTAFLTDLREVLEKHEAYIESQGDENGGASISIGSDTMYSLGHDLGLNEVLDAKYIDSVLNS